MFSLRTRLSHFGVKLATQKAAASTFFTYGNQGLAVLRKKDLEEVHHTDPGHDAEVFKRPELIGTGGKADPTFSPSVVEQGTGKERIEMMALLEGKDPYFGMTDDLVLEKQGTKKDPIVIVSPDTDRIIGCNGHPGHHHASRWFMITEDGHKYWEFGHNKCTECGNTYKLKKIDLPYGSIN